MITIDQFINNSAKYISAYKQLSYSLSLLSARSISPLIHLVYRHQHPCYLSLTLGNLIEFLFPPKHTLVKTRGFFLSFAPTRPHMFPLSPHASVNSSLTAPTAMKSLVYMSACCCLLATPVTTRTPK